MCVCVCAMVSVWWCSCVWLCVAFCVVVVWCCYCVYVLCCLDPVLFVCDVWLCSVVVRVCVVYGVAVVLACV